MGKTAPHEKKIRVAVVDDHPALCAGVKALLNLPDMEYAGEAYSTVMAVDLVLDTEPDLVILDVKMMGGEGHETLRAIKRARAKTGVIIFTAFCQVEDLVEAAVDGAAGFLLKRSGPDELVSLVRKVGRSSEPPSPDWWKAVLADMLAKEPPAGTQAAASKHLSPAEVETLICLAKGLNTHEIAKVRGVCDTTIRTFIWRIEQKLEASGRTQLLLKAMKCGVLPRSMFSRTEGKE